MEKKKNLRRILNNNMNIREEMDLSEAIIDEATNAYLLTNVKIIGTKSKNKREYPINTLEKAASLYENHAVYCDHDHSGKNRKYTDRIGNLKHVTIKEDGLYSDLQINPKHHLAESIRWDFMNNSRDVGLSHDAEGDLSNGKCTKITKLKSIDLVVNPATTFTLREEEESEIEVIKKQLTETIDSVKLLTEANVKLVEEIKELKAKKVVSHNPMPEIKETKFDLNEWVKQIKGNK